MRAALATLRRWARALKQQSLVVYCIARDRRTPWAVKLLAVLVAAYALSPIDLIPDFIPVLGLLDDLLLVPLGVLQVLRLVPESVRRDAQARAGAMVDRPVSRAMGCIIVACWCVVALACVAWAINQWGR